MEIFIATYNAIIILKCKYCNIYKYDVIKNLIAAAAFMNKIKFVLTFNILAI